MKNNFLSVLGIALIIIPACVLNKESVFPGLNAFWPCLGTALLIFSGKEKNNLGCVNVMIQNKLMVQIGLISYSLYLWHWPIFVLIKYSGITLDGNVRLVAILITFIISYLSWKYIEQPFRTTLTFDFKKTMLGIFLPALVIVAIIYGIIDSKDGFPEREQNLTEFVPNKNYPNKLRKECFDKFKIGNCEECYIGVKKNKLDGMLIGDSFANHTAAFLDVLAKDANMYIHDSAAGGYPLMNNTDKDVNFTKYPKKYAIERLEYAKKFKNVFIAANWEGFDTKHKKTYTTTIKTLEELVKIKKNIYIFEPLRSMSSTNLHKAKLIKSKRTVFFPEKDCSIEEYKRPKDYIINEIKRKFPSIIIIDLNTLMCKNGKCAIELNHTIVYRNGNHLNTSGAKLLGELYLKKYGNPLKKINLIK